MLAVAILAIVATAVYQFTDVTLQSAKFYTETADEESVNAGLRRLIEAELASLPTGVQGALLGLRSHNRDGEHDTLQLVCAPGNGVLSADAHGNYEVLLEVRESPRKSGKYALGIERRPHEDDNDDDDDDTTNGGLKSPGANPARPNLPADWVPLVEGVRSLEIGYFDSRLNGWVERWTDQAVLPNLVRIRFSADESRPPYEFIARVPGGGVHQGVPTFNAPLNRIPGVQVSGQTGAGPAPVQPLPQNPNGAPLRQ